MTRYFTQIFVNGTDKKGKTHFFLQTRIVQTRLELATSDSTRLELATPKLELDSNSQKVFRTHLYSQLTPCVVNSCFIICACAEIKFTKYCIFLDKRLNMDIDVQFAFMYDEVVT